MLFVELALIRWTGSNVVHLSYFSNFVLLGSFLGIGLGFLIARKSWSVLPAAPIILFRSFSGAMRPTETSVGRPVGTPENGEGGGRGFGVRPASPRARNGRWGFRGVGNYGIGEAGRVGGMPLGRRGRVSGEDRKSTRLNSRHT